MKIRSRREKPDVMSYVWQASTKHEREGEGSEGREGTEMREGREDYNEESESGEHRKAREGERDVFPQSSFITRNLFSSPFHDSLSAT